MESYDKQKKGYIEVWLTNKEQELYDREELTKLILSKAGSSKCKVIFFLSGQGDLLKYTEDLLISNLGCA